MKNKKVIIINGFSRGGTSILWNIVQSHPKVCSTLYETRAILYPGQFFKDRTLIKFLSNKLIVNIIRPIIYLSIYIKPLFYLMKQLIDKRFYYFKLKNINSKDYKYKFENIEYNSSEIKKSILSLKSVDLDVYLEDFFIKTYPNIFSIGLIRNGYALCESWMRRGMTPKKAGKRYRIIGEKIIKDSKKYDNYIIVRFEDVVKEPFKIANEIFEFCQLQPSKLNKLRLKAKKIINEEGEQKCRYGVEDGRYWININEVNKFINQKINDIQKEKLSKQDLKEFEIYAKPILQYFKYI